MKSYLISLHEDKGDKFVMFFECWADDEDHAEEQALNAYPCAKIVHISPGLDVDNEGKTLKETLRQNQDNAKVMQDGNAPIGKRLI